MDIRGIWKVKEVRVPTPDGEKVFTPDNPPTDERFEGSAEMMQYRTEFAEDGVLNTLMFVPEDMSARQFYRNEGTAVFTGGAAYPCRENFLSAVARNEGIRVLF